MATHRFAKTIGVGSIVKLSDVQQGSFLHEHAHHNLIKSTRQVTATVVHSHRNQILHFESLVEIQMVAGT